jgi:hypothetical protein
VTSVDFASLVDRYVSIWNLPDEARTAELAEVFTADVYYADPTVTTRGQRELDRYIGVTRRRFGGMRFGVAGRIDGHHDQVRFGWHCGPAGGDPVVAGFDVALLEGGRIRAIHGFFD